MAISILPPAPAEVHAYNDSSDNASLDSDGDVDMADNLRPTKRARLSGKSIVTPGENITDDPQWMRCRFDISFQGMFPLIPFPEATAHSSPLPQPPSSQPSPAPSNAPTSYFQYVRYAPDTRLKSAIWSLAVSSKCRPSAGKSIYPLHFLHIYLSVP